MYTIYNSLFSVSKVSRLTNYAFKIGQHKTFPDATL